MKEVVRKIKNITNSLLGVVDVDSTTLEKRREVCNGCKYNSINQGSDNMSILDRIKDKASPFCTVCGCVIKLKTTQADEECALSTIGGIPKWGRIGYPVGNNREIGIINNSSLFGTVISINGGYEFNFGDVDTDGEVFNFYFDLLPIKGVKILHVVVGCSSCSIIEKQWKDNILSCMVILDLTKVKGNFDKKIFVTYTYNGEIKSLIIRYTGSYE